MDIGTGKSRSLDAQYYKGNGRRFLVGYTVDRAKMDAYNREKGVRRLEKSYKRGKLTKFMRIITICGLLNLPL